MLYAAVATTILAAYRISRSWGSTAALVFAVINALVIFVIPGSKLLGLIIAGSTFALVRESKPAPKGSDDA